MCLVNHYLVCGVMILQPFVICIEHLHLDNLDTLSIVLFV